jgi:hypothetical protein
VNDTPHSPPPEVEESARPTSRAPHFAAAAAAVIIIAAILLWPRMSSMPGAPPAESPRGEAAPAGIAEPIEPRGALAGAPAQFRWTSDPQADSYQLEIYDASGHVVAAAFVRDTLVPAAALGIDTLRAGSWVVVPIAADGAERAHHPQARFTVSGP